MHLIIAHYHFRPGGVRRVIECSTPSIVRALGDTVSSVSLLTGEAIEGPWSKSFVRALSPLPLQTRIDSMMAYSADMPRAAAPERHRREEAFRQRMLRYLEPGDVVWLHNASLARNLGMLRALGNACHKRGARLLLHHHDWWFDNRWDRWNEMQKTGIRTPADVAKIIFDLRRNVSHAVINGWDAAMLRPHLRGRVTWLPNPVRKTRHPSRLATAQARTWLKHCTGRDGAFWLLPCRLLRRKNIAEALLLMRWLDPDATLVTTGAVSSLAEQNYAVRLGQAARSERWPLALSILADRHRNAPPLPDLFSANDRIALTSLNEGFGLPFLEAAAAGRPLIARRLPHIVPDLERFGFSFPGMYDDVVIPTSLFNWKAEHSRQSRLFRSWKARLPSRYRASTQPPPWLDNAADITHLAFSRLTLTAQLELLRLPPVHSWNACVPLNPGLKGLVCVSPSSWPAEADRWVGDAAYADRFLHALRPPRSTATDRKTPLRCQDEFARQRLGPLFQYPLLWSNET